METSSKRLDEIMKEINTIHIEARNPEINRSLEKKLQNYNKANILVEEATQLLNKMEIDIQKLDANQIDSSSIFKINDWIEWLTDRTLKFDEVVYIITQLQAIASGLPSDAEFIDNVDQEIIYEEEEQDVKEEENDMANA